MSESQNSTQIENIALINYIINKLETSMFCSYGLLKVGDGYALFNKAQGNKYNYTGSALPNYIELLNNNLNIYSTFNDFINPQQYTQIPICFLFKKMDLPNFIEIIKNKEDSFYTDLKSHYQTDEVNENHINHFYENYNIYVTPFRFMYCQLKESRARELNFNLYFMGTTTTALIHQDNLYEDCDSLTRLTRDTETRILNNLVSDVFESDFPVAQSPAPVTPSTPRRRGSRNRSAPNSNVSSLNSGSPTITVTNFPQFDSPNSMNSPIENWENTTPTPATSSNGEGTSRSLFNGGKNKRKKGHNKKTKRKSNQSLKKVKGNIKRGSCKVRSTCKK